ncbi:MAG: DNA-binding response regulator [Herbaspirillum sp.]|jgi:two-component system OmpR family response regulator|nr:DNA-binding response regulator [Herbaspirillum sp.]
MTDIVEVLIVDDDAAIRNLLITYLSDFGIQATAAGDGAEMRQALASKRFDIIILDLMLPSEDGLSLCRGIRTVSDIPIVMLTARAESADKVACLEVGADDYVIKPFDPRELVARLHTILRRAAGKPQAVVLRPQASNQIAFGGWTLNRTTRELTSPQRLVIPLSNGEFRLLWAFIEKPRVVLSRSELLSAARGRTMEAFDRTIDLMVSRLRQKLEEDVKTPQLLRTIRGEGYFLDTEVNR